MLNEIKAGDDGHLVDGDQWIAIGDPDNKDWFQIGNTDNAGKSYVESYGYPPWGDKEETEGHN